MSSKQYYYKPQQDTVVFTAPDFVLVTFGTITTTEEDNTKEAQWVRDTFTAIKQAAPAGRLRVLMDFRTIDSGEFNSHESNKIYQAILQDPAIARVALFGLHHGWQLMVDLLRVFVPTKLKTFDTEAEARAWLYAAD
ncbi:MAG: STAS/SEC14 domain-containing protein [Candidatus Kerfeldbacteria bacterium]|nr:STAS/SEC14 domain-containing protein [Candidatus Kerfeldbacteria bacterium]